MRRTNDFLVGVVVVVCTVALIGATLWMNQADFGTQGARVVARFREVGNINVGSAVVIRGVPAGRVDAVELADGGWVRVRLRLDDSVELPRNPVVLLNAASLFGEWQATIMSREALPPSADVRRQVEEASRVPGEIPGAMLPDIAQLTTVAGGIAGNVSSVAERFGAVFDDTAVAKLRASIANVALLSSELASTVQRQSRNLDGVAARVRDGADEMKSAAEAVRRIAERIDSSSSEGQIREIADNLSRATQQLDSASRQVRALTVRLSDTQSRLDRVLSSSDSVMSKLNAGRGTLGLLVNDPSLYWRADSLVRQINALVADVRSNPKRYVNLRIF